MKKMAYLSTTYMPEYRSPSFPRRLKADPITAISPATARYGRMPFLRAGMNRSTAKRTKASPTRRNSGTNRAKSMFMRPQQSYLE